MWCLLWFNAIHFTTILQKHLWRWLLLESCQLQTWNFTKMHTPPQVFLTFCNAVNGPKSQNRPHLMLRKLQCLFIIYVCESNFLLMSCCLPNKVTQVRYLETGMQYLPTVNLQFIWYNNVKLHKLYLDENYKKSKQVLLLHFTYLLSFTFLTIKNNLITNHKLSERGWWQTLM